MNTTELKETHWHAADVSSWQRITESVPAIIETELNLWALRIERNKAGIETPHKPHKYLMTVTALRYAMQGGPDGIGVFAPIEPRQELTFYVAADNSRAATEAVQAELVAHGYQSHEWSLGFTSGNPLILDGGDGFGVISDADPGL